MKRTLVAAAAVVLIGGVASAQTVKSDQSVTVKKKQFKKPRLHVSGGDYVPGIPKHDPGSYSNLPGKDADYSKAFIQDR